MENFTGVKKKAHGFYAIYIAGEMVTFAKNPKAAKEKLAKEETRAQMNAQRAAAQTAWCVANPEAAYLIAERAGMRNA